MNTASLGEFRIALQGLMQDVSLTGQHFVVEKGVDALQDLSDRLESIEQIVKTIANRVGVTSSDVLSAQPSPLVTAPPFALKAHVERILS
jgi:hypothetical protein